jgi:retinol-binding protein 3
VLALQDLAKNATGPNRADIDWAVTGLQARLKPVALSAQDMQALVGAYGIRKIWIEDGKLRYQREGRPPLTLVAMGNDLFGFVETANIRVKFRRTNGKVTGFDQLTDDGRVIPVERTA